MALKADGRVPLGRGRC